MITLSSLRRVAQEVGEKLSEDELHEMILLADRAKAHTPPSSLSRTHACVRVPGGPLTLLIFWPRRSGECCTKTSASS
jgi:hypothetical protein